MTMTVEKVAIRALIRLLLETHSERDVAALMQCTVSGREVTFGQIHRQRRNMLAKGAEARRKRARAAVIDVPNPVVADVAPRSANAAPETFESQMARIAAGARLIAAPDLRAVGPSHTLGGVASGML